MRPQLFRASYFRQFLLQLGNLGGLVRGRTLGGLDFLFFSAAAPSDDLAKTALASIA